MGPELDGLPSLEPELLVATLSGEGETVFRNEAWRQVVGERAQWDRMTDSDRERALQCIAEAASGSLVTNQFFQIRVPERDEPLPVLLNFLPIYLPGTTAGESRHGITITGEVLREPGTWMRSQTQRNRLETLGRMTMGIAHDFNNLLSGILGYTELLKTYVTDPALTDHLGTIEKAALDGASLIRKIQQYIRQEKQIHFEPVDLPTLIQDCITLTRPYWYNEPRRQGIAIQMDHRFEEVPAVVGSAAELREVFLNLILNAVQAMPAGGTVTFETRTGDDGRVRVGVTDTGSGMTENVMKRIFEPLFTTKGDRGTGMGLAVAYGIVQEHDGTISVESRPGKGTRFELSFPAADEAVREEQPAAEGRDGLQADVLVVDDERMVRNILVKLLTLKGHRVRQAASGAEALEMADHDRFDIVFTDHGMPEMNGRQLAHALRQRFPELPIVLLTGDTEIGEAGEDVDVILTKPFILDELEETIQDLLQ